VLQQGDDAVDASDSRIQRILHFRQRTDEGQLLVAVS